jgi:LemA protein
MVGIILVGIIFFLFVIAIFYSVGIYNRLISLKNAVPQAFANIDVLLKQRHDELPKLLDVVKGYAAHERETLENVIKARNMYANANSIDEKIESNNFLTGALKSLFALSEKYPDLKANENFLNLQRRVTDIENSIADRREVYNYSVTNFNTQIEQFPSVVFANMMHLKPFPLFKATKEDKEDVSLGF